MPNPSFLYCERRDRSKSGCCIATICYGGVRRFVPKTRRRVVFKILGAKCTDPDVHPRRFRNGARYKQRTAIPPSLAHPAGLSNLVVSSRTLQFAAIRVDKAMLVITSTLANRIRTKKLRRGKEVMVDLEAHEKTTREKVKAQRTKFVIPGPRASADASPEQKTRTRTISRGSRREIRRNRAAASHQYFSSAPEQRTWREEEACSIELRKTQACTKPKAGVGGKVTLRSFQAGLGEKKPELGDGGALAIGCAGGGGGRVRNATNRHWSPQQLALPNSRPMEGTPILVCVPPLSWVHQGESLADEELQN
ncbi:hypothetical protein F5146DRAFT_1002231 [Armillaria mellea]|nr:hypothetical protein F5146DRAFT_1002231 [Armillaria mellea]